MQPPISSLKGKLRLEFMDAYGDGTVHGRIEDEAGQKVEICIDGREGSPTRHRLFQKARHPRQTGAELIDLGADEEGIVIPLMSQWIDSDEARRELTQFGLDLVRERLARLGDST